ncbi:hypothetical protein [Paenibacillus lignilyticus]|uniref:Uncharacterized protein n=1 Tax=Paenibacillus lignilyticus TaxID=1172615 RepID=A0ABS5CAL5_9BACL|nr:hypothetical protein [Paenibacillus lignilyticus]MBP3962495.1 hypothetical protein [Paenibacillus lignilyticus]
MQQERLGAEAQLKLHPRQERLGAEGGVGHLTASEVTVTSLSLLANFSGPTTVTVTSLSLAAAISS